MMKKVLLPLIIAALSLMTTSVYATSGYWSGSPNRTLEVNVNNPNEFIIRDAADLAQVAYLVNNGENNFSGKTILLGAPIDLSAHYWVPIGTTVKPFMGSFDGQGHTISGMKIGGDGTTDYVDSGLFGYIVIPDDGPLRFSRVRLSADNGAEIKVMNPENTTCAGLIGLVTAKTNDADIRLELTDCHNEIPIRAEKNAGGNTMGGLIGLSHANTQLIRCTNSGNLWGDKNTSTMGGLVGFIHHSLILSACVNSGSMEGESESPCFGGLVAFSRRKLMISNSLNSGKIVATSKGNGSLGGLVASTDGFCLLSDSYSVAAISWKGSGYVGGIVGYLDSNNLHSEISNCFAAGSIVTNEEAYTGGIIGFVCGSKSENPILISGNVVMLSKLSEGESHRILGSVASTTRLTENYAYVPNYPVDASDAMALDGANWSGYMSDSPFAEWDNKCIWQIDPTNQLMPKNRLLGGRNIDIENIALNSLVRFNTMGGSNVAPYKMNSGDLLPTPKTPTRAVMAYSAGMHRPTARMLHGTSTARLQET